MLRNHSRSHIERRFLAMIGPQEWSKSHPFGPLKGPKGPAFIQPLVRKRWGQLSLGQAERNIINLKEG